MTLKKKAVEFLGGKCNRCGYCKSYAAFDFHHIDPTQKEMHWTKMRKGME